MFKKLKFIDSTTLKVLAMVLMLSDHIWGTGILPYDWLTAIGRIAFPIFAFQIAEGCARTHNFKGYLKRMLLFALISEIPFNFMMGGSIFYPLHQNVMFTFLIAMLLIRGLQRFWEKHPGAIWKISSAAVAMVLGYMLGFATFCDYYGYGVVTVLLFWLTRDKKWGWIAQLIGLFIINWVLMSGMSYVVHIFGTEIWVPQQALALLALIPIWLYNGKRGPGGKWFQFFGYAFYPLHIALLLLIRALF